MLARLMFACSFIFAIGSIAMSADELKLQLRYQQETEADSGRYHRLLRQENWKPSKTAIIVCDVWDYHHCLNAVKRVGEFAPRLNQVLINARNQGVTIIHSPSDCMAAYEKHPARHRAMKSPAVSKLPADIKSWCSRIPAEEKAAYPIDQSDGGEDDDPNEHAEWAAKLKEMGRNPGMPWKSQSKLIEIDKEQDYISDRGDEVWNVLEERGIKNVILTGVHVNMCVLGRPFGLRQLSRNGKNVVLMRDMTDTMYNPQRWPYVSHFTGNDLIISHIERFVCPTITSDQLLGGKSFRFKNDKRPHIAILIAEKEYRTNETLPEFAAKYLGKDFRVSYVFDNAQDRNDLPGLEVLNEADIALISVRRRVLSAESMRLVKKFASDGKPIVGIRTASHAFSLNKAEPPKGLTAWPELDAEIFGGNYHGHHGNKLKSTVRLDAGTIGKGILSGIENKRMPQGGSLYKTSPLNSSANVLAMASIDGATEIESEPVAWTFVRRDGGKSFYTSLGHIDDFNNPAFVRLLSNAIYWAADLEARKNITNDSGQDHWNLTSIPTAPHGESIIHNVPTWYRCAIRIPSNWIAREELSISIDQPKAEAWFNGQKLSAKDGKFTVRREWIQLDDANLLVVRLDRHDLEKSPTVQAGSNSISLKGRWQFRKGDDLAWSNIPLPAKFGASTDILFEPK